MEATATVLLESVFSEKNDNPEKIITTDTRLLKDFLKKK